MAGAAGLEPVTSAVTGQRSNQLSYAPAGAAKNRKLPSPGQVVSRKMFGQQTPRRWGWGTPLKKRAATRTKEILGSSHLLSTGYRGDSFTRISHDGVECPLDNRLLLETSFRTMGMDSDAPVDRLWKEYGQAFKSFD